MLVSCDIRMRLFWVENRYCNWLKILRDQHYIYIYVYIYHHIMLLARTSQTLSLSHHSSLSPIASGRSSRLHPVSVQCCCRLILVGCPILARLREEVHWRRRLWVYSSFSSSVPYILSVLLRRFLRWEIGGRAATVLWDVAPWFLFNMTRSILVQFSFSFFRCALSASMWCTIQ